MMQFQLKNLTLIASIAAALGFAVAYADMDSAIETNPLESETETSLTMDQDVEVLLLRAGIGPACLSAAGLNASSVQSLFASQQVTLEASASQLAGLDATCADTKRTMDSLRRKVQSGLATSEEVTTLAQAKTAHASASSARDQFLAGVVSSFTGEMSTDAKEAINNIIASKRWKQVPMAYRVQHRTEAQWVELKNALAAKRTHENIGEEAPTAAATYIAQADADESVAQAKANCDACLSGVEGLWASVFAVH